MIFKKGENMAEQNFGCCSSYMECSNKEKCIKPEIVNYCNYWRYNLSRGNNFYCTKNNDETKLFSKIGQEYQISIFELISG